MNIRGEGVNRYQGRRGKWISGEKVDGYQESKG